MRFNQSNDDRGKIARMARRLNVRAGCIGLPPVVLLTDDGLAVNWDEAVKALPRGSAVVVRHRDAGLQSALAIRLHPVCRSSGIRLMVSNNADLAHRVGAGGLHLSQDRVHLARRFKRARPDWLVTGAAHGRPSLLRAQRSGCDAAFVSPLFQTQSHAGADALGSLRFAQIRIGTQVPVYPLGGIGVDNVSLLQTLNVCGVGLIRGWL